MALMVCLLYTQALASFSSLWLWACVTSWLLCWLKLCCPPKSLQCVSCPHLQVSNRDSVLGIHHLSQPGHLSTSEGPCARTKPVGVDFLNPSQSFLNPSGLPTLSPLVKVLHCGKGHTGPGAVMWASLRATLLSLI